MWGEQTVDHPKVADLTRPPTQRDGRLCRVDEEVLVAVFEAGRHELTADRRECKRFCSERRVGNVCVETSAGGRTIGGREQTDMERAGLAQHVRDNPVGEERKEDREAVQAEDEKGA